MSIEFRVLGQLEVVRGGAPVGLDVPKQRALLALLLVHAGQVLPADRILEELWGDQQPEGGSATLRYHVSKLRDVLDPDRKKGTAGTVLITGTKGYGLRVEPDQIDAEQFTAISERGHQLLDSDPEKASHVLREALDVWRGSEQSFADFQYEQFAKAAIAQLQELRVRTIEDRIAADLENGRHEEVLGELEGLVERYPLRERIAGLHMVALYRDGRQGEALRAFNKTREHLGEELGIDPSPSLIELEEQILLRDERLTHATLPRRHNLPAPTTALIDRIEDREAVARLLQERRIVTLTGLGGIGKSRLAVAAAEAVIDDHRDGVWFVAAYRHRTADHVVAEIAEVLGLSGVASRRPDLAAVRDHCRLRELLLVLDGCEHLVGELVEVCETLTRSCAGVSLLLTSRERLRLEGEAVWIVDPLALPPGSTAAETAASPAGALFVDRAIAALPDFRLDDDNAAAVAEVCRRLDGIPLAIEMAAPRLGTLSAAELAERLTDRFSLLKRGDADRGRRGTLRAVIDWSHDLLAPAEQILLRRLAVFRGGFRLDAVEAVCAHAPLEPDTAIDLLQRLEDTSFVRTRGAEERRFRLLDTLREYALEKLEESGEGDEVAEHHAVHYAGLARLGSEHLSGAGQATWLRRMDSDNSNLRAALVHAIESEDHALALDLAANLGGFWFERGYHVDARLLLTDALVGEQQPASRQLVEVLADLAVLVMLNGAMDEATKLAERLRMVAKNAGDARSRIRWLRFEMTLAWVHGDYRRAAQMARAAMDEMRSSDEAGIAIVIGQLAGVEVQLGHADEAERLTTELRSSRERLGQPEAEPLIADLRGWQAFQGGDAADAVIQWGEAAAGYEALGLHNNVVDTHLLGAWASLESGDGPGARMLARQALTESQASAASLLEARGLAVLAWVDLESGDQSGGARFLARALARTHDSGDRCWTLWSLMNAASQLSRSGVPDRAARLVGSCEALRDRIGVVPPASAAARFASLIAGLRDHMGPKLESERAAGSSFDYDEAVAFAAVGLEASSSGT